MFFFCLVAAPSAKADPITFGNVLALQNDGLTTVNLLANSGGMLFGPQISFLVDINGTIPPGGTVLRISFTQGLGPAIVQTFPIPLFDGIDPPYTQLFTINALGATFAGTPATLTITIPEFGSQTFSFLVAEPVPEPTSIVLLTLGGLGVWSRIRRRRPEN